MNITYGEYLRLSYEERESIPMEVRLAILEELDKQHQIELQKERDGQALGIKHKDSESDIEDRIKRSKAIKKFDKNLLPIVKSYHARYQRLYRAKQWSRTTTEQDMENLLNELYALSEEKSRISQDALRQWYTQYPDIIPPSFSPSAVLRRVSRSKPFDRYRPSSSHSTLDPNLQEILDRARNIIEELI